LIVKPRCVAMYGADEAAVTSTDHAQPDAMSKGAVEEFSA
jgi:hypothetical protein